MLPLRATLVALAVALMNSATALAQARLSDDRKDNGTTTIVVAGSGVDHLTSALMHSKKATPNGMIQHSTQIVDLIGDLEGRVLYHVTTVVDTARGTLVNTGDQVYSGTIAGSAPVLIHDDQFRFDVNLVTRQETGRVYLLDHIAGPKVQCTLDVVGTGMTPDGDPTFTYKGHCTFRGTDDSRL